MKEHPCPSCPPTIQRTCAETGSFPCEERKSVTKEQVASAPHYPAPEADIDKWKESLEI